jgi:hypothetical protein
MRVRGPLAIKRERSDPVMTLNYSAPQLAAGGAIFPGATRSHGGAAMRGKRVQFDDETWHALNLLAHDQMKDFQELADEAFRDLLRKHGRPFDLKEALRRSAGVSNVVPLQGAKKDKEAKDKSSSKSKTPPKGSR